MGNSKCILSLKSSHLLLKKLGGSTLSHWIVKLFTSCGSRIEWLNPAWEIILFVDMPALFYLDITKWLGCASPSITEQFRGGVSGWPDLSAECVLRITSLVTACIWWDLDVGMTQASWLGFLGHNMSPDDPPLPVLTWRLQQLVWSKRT